MRVTGLARHGVDMHTTHPFPTATRVPVNGVELEVFAAGDPAGEPVVLLHGWPEHAFSWRHQIAPLAAAGHHVIVPNQRGYGRSSTPSAVTDYDLTHLSGDVIGLLDHYGHDEATLVGHDWGANVAWGTTLLHPERISRVAALSLPYQPRGDVPWIEWMEAAFGGDFYFVHFNRQPGVADAVLDANVERFLRNLYRTDLPPPGAPQPGNVMANLALAQDPLGQPVLTDDELAVFVEAFEATGFGPSISWYRNLDRNWHLLADVDPVITQPALMVYGARDLIARNEALTSFVPNVEVVEVDAGHWIQQEQPEQVTAVLAEWLAR